MLLGFAHIAVYCLSLAPMWLGMHFDPWDPFIDEDLKRSAGRCAWIGTISVATCVAFDVWSWPRLGGRTRALVVIALALAALNLAMFGWGQLRSNHDDGA